MKKLFMVLREYWDAVTCADTRVPESKWNRFTQSFPCVQGEFSFRVFYSDELYGDNCVITVKNEEGTYFFRVRRDAIPDLIEVLSKAQRELGG